MDGGGVPGRGRVRSAAAAARAASVNAGHRGALQRQDMPGDADGGAG